jgi:hypothetical protein
MNQRLRLQRAWLYALTGYRSIDSQTNPNWKWCAGFIALSAPQI